MGAPEYIFLAIILAGGAWYYAGQRGKLMVRAFIYISELAAGRTQAEANMTALSLDYNAASRFATIAKNYVDLAHNGRQLDLISEARLQGFKG